MAIDSTQAAITTFRDQISKVGWRHRASNIGVAFLFFLTLFQTQLDYGSSLANWIWLGGAALMGVLVLVRVPPRSSMVTASTLLATGVSIVLPALIHPERPSHGLLAGAAIVVELCGVTLGQVGRIYLGRRFALLPADRGIVTNGPFRFVRHPIYAGWLILSIGYVMAFPTIRNGLIIMVTLPFILWRCLQEEALLSGDPNYCDYLARTRWRLVPGIY